MIFLDTNFLVALEVEKDENHKKSLIVRDKIVNNEYGNSVISDYIFDETMTVTFMRLKDLEKTVAIGTKLRGSPIFIRLEESDFEETWKLFRNQKDTKFSFTDCSNLAIMKRLNIKNIATFDGDFEKIDEINVIQ